MCRASKVITCPARSKSRNRGAKVPGLVGCGAHLGLGEGDGTVVGDGEKQVAAPLTSGHTEGSSSQLSGQGWGPWVTGVRT